MQRQGGNDEDDARRFDDAAVNELRTRVRREIKLLSLKPGEKVRVDSQVKDGQGISEAVHPMS